MGQLMNALTISNGIVQMNNTPKPVTAAPGHVLVKMEYCAINPGDKAFINRPLPPGSVLSLHGIYGVSGAGTVLEIGDGVPLVYAEKKVSMYRSLKYSDQMVGTWCEYAHVPYLDCVILPDDSNLEDYSGSMVNIITPYAFLQQVMTEGHKGIISTAGTSATGVALLGICLAYKFPLISIVRNAKGRKALEALGAKNVVVQDNPEFKDQLARLGNELGTTAIFDGVGGEVLNKIIDVIPNNAVIYSYGYLGDAVPLTVQMRILTAKNTTIRPFANFKTATVQDPEKLEQALKAIGEIVHQSHFKTRVGKKFKLAEIDEALLYSDNFGGKAVLTPSE